MKIYRFVPNDRDYRHMPKNTTGKWWPDGIHLGSLENIPKSYGGDLCPWAHEGNQFRGYPKERPLSDFPALTLQVPILSERAVRVLSQATNLDVPAEITLDGERFFAAQPKTIPGVFDSKASNGLTLSQGDVFFYYRRCFDVSKVNAEFFRFEGDVFSELYVTDRLVEASAAAGLKGLEYVELVFDDEGPVVPKYPGAIIQKDQLWDGRLWLDYDLIRERASGWGYLNEEIDEAVRDAVARGFLTFEYVQPTYER